MNTQTTFFDLPKIAWHISANCFGINATARAGILNTLKQVNDGELTLDDEIKEGANVTVAEMCEDLKIDF